MTQIFGEIDTVAKPVVFTPWFWRHMANSMGGFMGIYAAFILLKFMFNRYPIKKNKKQYIIFYFIIQYCVLMGAKPHKYDENACFAIVNSLILYLLTSKYYLGPNKHCIKNKNPLDKFFCKKYKGKYNKLNPFTQNVIFNLSLWVWFYSHTVYEYYTAGSQAKDSWAEAELGSSSIPDDHILTNSYANSVGDTIGGFIGCLFLIVTIKKYGVCWGLPMTYWWTVYTGPACIEIYRDMGWTID